MDGRTDGLQGVISVKWPP